MNPHFLFSPNYKKLDFEQPVVSAPSLTLQDHSRRA
jgi:hypothetical protein